MDFSIFFLFMGIWIEAFGQIALGPLYLNILHKKSLYFV